MFWRISVLKFPKTTNPNNQKPIIGLTTYRKVSAQATPLPLMALMPSYIEAVAAAGGVPVLIPLGLDEESLRILISIPKRALGIYL